jgi:hypothetical protein
MAERRADESRMESCPRRRFEGSSGTGGGLKGALEQEKARGREPHLKNGAVR